MCLSRNLDRTMSAHGPLKFCLSKSIRSPQQCASRIRLCEPGSFRLKVLSSMTSLNKQHVQARFISDIVKFQENNLQHLSTCEPFSGSPIKLNRTSFLDRGSSLASSCTCRAERKTGGRVVVAINCLLPMMLKTSPLVKRRTTNVQFRQRMTTHRQQSQGHRRS